MRKKLIVTGGTRDRELQLVGRIVVGRDPGCEISHDDSLLSRRHAEFVTAGEVVTIRDLGSRNGVFVNGARAAEQRLEVGDVVQIGPLRARYVADDSPGTITPERMDTERTAVFGRVAAASAPAAVEHHEGGGHAEEDDDDVTRLVPAPRLPKAAAARRPPEAAARDAGDADDADDDEERTRFVSAPDIGPATVVSMPAPAGPAAVVERPAPVMPAPVLEDRRPAVAAPSADGGLKAFVFAQVLSLAVVVLAAALLPFMLTRGVAAAVAEVGFMPFEWLALPLVIALVATCIVGTWINRRITLALADAERKRT